MRDKMFKVGDDVFWFDYREIVLSGTIIAVKPDRPNADVVIETFDAFVVKSPTDLQTERQKAVNGLVEKMMKDGTSKLQAASKILQKESAKPVELPARETGE